MLERRYLLQKTSMTQNSNIISVDPAAGYSKITRVYIFGGLQNGDSGSICAHQTKTDGLLEFQQVQIYEMVSRQEHMLGIMQTFTGGVAMLMRDETKSRHIFWPGVR
jgi:hypothetical protein